MEHLALEVFDLGTGGGSQFANLPPNTTIRIRRTSQIFGSGSVFTQEFTLNVAANAHLFGTAGDIHGSRLHEQMNKRKARIWAMGLPLYLGYLRLADEVEVDGDGNIDLTFESGQKTFEDMIEGAKANQVPMMGDVQIGMALWRKRWTICGVKIKASVEFDDGKTEDVDVKKNNSSFLTIATDGENAETPTQQYPRMVFPKGSFFNEVTRDWEDDLDFLNTDSPYTENADGAPSHPFCNVALCYQKYDFKKTDKDGRETYYYSSEPEAQRGYEYMPANRVNSAPNFFVLYWLRCLMKHLGIYVEENQMLGIEDLRRLFFVNTNCDYIVPNKLRSATDNSRFGKYSTLVGKRKSYNYIPERFTERPLVKTDESGFKCTYQTDGPTGHTTYFSDAEKTIKSVTVSIVDTEEWGDNHRDSDVSSRGYQGNNNYFHSAFATSECFPNVDISEVIQAIENGFGVRFLFSEDYKRVRVVLLRNVFRSSETQEVNGEIVGEDIKEDNNIRGFRMTYGDNQDNTEFYYKGFADKLPHKKELWPDTSDTHDYSQWSLNENYSSLIHKVSAFDKTCYVTPNNGNAYGIKVDKDAKRYDEQHPSLFGFADYMDAEDGDCSGEDETIKTVSVGFAPAIMNDLNMKDERYGNTDKQRFALFVDETMRPRRLDLNDGTDYNDSDAEYDVNGKLYAKNGDDYVYGNKMKDGSIIAPGEFSITSDIHAAVNGLTAHIKREKREVGGTAQDWPTINWDLSLSIDGHINEGYRLYLQDNYEPNDDGVSPIENHDWGLTLGIMRGSGDDAYVKYTPDDIEYEDPKNDWWKIIPGSSVTAHPDTCDNYGREWDYNGSNITVASAEEAVDMLNELFPASTRNAPFYINGKGYINGATIYKFFDGNGGSCNILVATSYSESGRIFNSFYEYAPYFNYLDNHNAETIKDLDADGLNGVQNIVLDLNGNEAQIDTLLKLCRIAYGGSQETMIIDNGIGIEFGRFSLKLRAEKPNPYFNPALEENSTTNRRYLEITNQNLRGRGLCDQFYKEYSYWVRNARIVKRTVRMELAQLLSIDDTVRVTVGDVTGFINEMEYDIDMQTGLGNVTMKIMYI